MKVNVCRTSPEGLETVLNNIGYENVLQIIPEHSYDGCLMLIIYKGEKVC